MSIVCNTEYNHSMESAIGELSEQVKHGAHPRLTTWSSQQSHLEDIHYESGTHQTDLRTSNARGRASEGEGVCRQRDCTIV